jgi:hypothetical protein
MRLFNAVFLLSLCIPNGVVLAHNAQERQVNRRALVNSDITDMLDAGLSPEIVTAKIAASICEFDTSPGALKALKTRNVPGSVILAMVQAPALVRREGVSTEEPSQFATIRCKQPDQVPVFLATTTELSSSHAGSDLVESFHVKCGDRIILLNSTTTGQQTWDKIRTPEGQVGYISSLLVSRDEHAGSKAASTTSRKAEKLQKANDDLEDCRVGFQNDYETRMGVLNTMALGPTVRLASASRLKQNLDAELRDCRSRYELRVKAIEGE